MTTWLHEPGFLLLVSILAITVVQALGAWLGRSRFARLEKLCTELSNDPAANDSDRAWISYFVSEALDRREPFLVGLFAPVAILATVPSLWLEARGENLRAENRPITIDGAYRRLIEDETGIDPRQGALWKDPRRHEMSDLSSLAQAFSSPIASIILICWLVISTPVFVIAYLLSISPVKLIGGMAAPYREAIIRVSALAHRAFHGA